jgi:hypothetical protein
LHAAYKFGAIVVPPVKESSNHGGACRNSSNDCAFGAIASVCVGGAAGHTTAAHTSSTASTVLRSGQTAKTNNQGCCNRRPEEHRSENVSKHKLGPPVLMFFVLTVRFSS